MKVYVLLNKNYLQKQKAANRRNAKSRAANNAVYVYRNVNPRKFGGKVNNREYANPDKGVKK